MVSKERKGVTADRRKEEPEQQHRVVVGTLRSSESWTGGWRDALGPDDEKTPTLGKEIRILSFKPLVLKL